MSKEEHLVENAIHNRVRGWSFEKWKNWELTYGNAVDGNVSNEKFDWLWNVVAYYVIYSLYCGPEDFKENHPWSFPDESIEDYDQFLHAALESDEKVKDR